MARSQTRMCSICKEDHALLTSSDPGYGNVCICDRCHETVAKEHFVWICLGCREVYCESKKLLMEREPDPALRRYYRDSIGECVIHALDTCINCCGEKGYEAAGEAADLICC